LLPPPIAWLGGTDELVEGTWVWETFEPFSYTNWSPGEPNNSGNEDGIITWGSNTWNDHKLHIPEKWVLEVEGARFVQTAGLAQNALFPKGTTTNTFVVTDAAGLTNQCSFTITVVDNIPPTITCPPNKTVNADPGSCSATGVVLGNPAASDNCTGLVVTNNGPATYPVGTTTVTHTANDGTNSVTCNQTVTVVDNQLPTITCPTNMMVNVDPGTCGARVIYTSPIASDNCDPATPAGYTYHSQGLGSYYYLSTTTADYHTARANARAAGGHLAVVTSAAENALIPPPIAWLGGMDELVEGTWVWETFEPFIYTNWSPGEPNNSGNEDGIITWGSNTWNDHKLHIPEKWVLEVEGARFVQTAGLAQNAIFPKGTTTNTFVVTDAAGLTNQCSFTITVVDNIAPTVVCKPHTVSLDASGQATIVPANIFQSGSDNCGTVNLQSVSPNSFTCINEGLNQVTLTVNDGNNNTATCTAVVTVQDNIAPSAVCQNATVQLGANGNGSLPAISVSVGPVAGALPNQGDANAPLNTVCDCPAGYVAVGYEGFAGCIIDDFRLICKELMPDGTLGATTAVTCFSSGLSGTSSGAKVLSGNNVMVGATIEDRNYNFSPYRTLKYLNGHGKSIADIIARAVNSTGTIAIASLNGSGCFSNSPVTTSQYAPAGYVITGMYAYHSGANYTNNVAFRYSPIIVSSPLDGGSYDNCGIFSSVASQTSFTCADLGLNNVTLTVYDVHGNTGTCTATVTVIDNENPTITCPAPITVNNDGGQCSAVVSYLVSGTDNCSFTLSQTAGQASGTAFPVGTTNNSFTATDPANNSVGCSFTVTVIDNENPTITCPAPITVNNDGGQCSAVVSYTVSGSDNCSFLLAQTGGLASGSAFPVGVTTNSWTSTDPSNNSVGCSFTVTVLKSGDPDLLWAYTAIGLDEVKMKKNTVQSGGVGVVNAGKKAKLEHATMVTATNTFVKAPVLDLNGGSQVATYYPGQVSASLLPAFLPYSGTCNNNLNIPDNSGPVTLNLACYKDITVGKNVSVTFSGHATINVKDLKLKEGSSVSFAQNTNLLIEKKLDSDKYVTISNNGNMVWIYVDDHVKIDDGNSITANIYCQKHIHVDKTPVGNPTYMTGLFIAEKIDSKDNVYWNWDASVCPFSTPLMLAGPPSITGPVAEMEEGLLMELFPNPASDDVNIHLHGTESAAMLTIHDQLGRLVWTGQMEAGQIATVINLGDARFGAGIYTVTAVSNGEKMVQRLVIAR